MWIRIETLGGIVGGYVTSEFLFPIYTKNENMDQVVQDLSTEMILSKLIERVSSWLKG